VELLRRYRFLMLIYGAAFLAGLYEFLDNRPPEEPADVMLELYPDSSEIQYKLARYFQSQGDLRKARIHFENALETRVKTDENLFWHYALTLVLLKADPAEIDKAVAAWRYNFPDSKRPDPREPEALHYDQPRVAPSAAGQVRR